VTYRVKEVFATLQGEGLHAGRASVFLRFAGCNLWNGLDKDRARDAERNGAKCPVFCDTDFVGGDTLTAAEVADRVVLAAQDAGMDPPPLIVITGGEPFLQIDRELIQALRGAYPDAILAVETNGTVAPKVPHGVREGVDHVCVSPKTPPDRIVIRRGTELKVVVPSYNPQEYAEITAGFDHLFVSPEAVPHAVGVSVLNVDNIRRAAAYCQAFPEWRLSLQTHKITGVP